MTTNKVTWEVSPKRWLNALNISKNELISSENLDRLKSNELLSLETANQMTENLIGTFSLPFSLAPDFQIDGAIFNVPMVTEEPSVVAAASFAAKIIKRSEASKLKFTLVK